jgi:hypothetical protein
MGRRGGQVAAPVLLDSGGHHAHVLISGLSTGSGRRTGTGGAYAGAVLGRGRRRIPHIAPARVLRLSFREPEGTADCGADQHGGGGPVTIPFPDDEYLRLVGRLAYAVAYLEGGNPPAAASAAASAVK